MSHLCILEQSFRHHIIVELVGLLNKTTHLRLQVFPTMLARFRKEFKSMYSVTLGITVYLELTTQLNSL